MFDNSFHLGNFDVVTWFEIVVEIQMTFFDIDFATLEVVVEKVFVLL